MFVYFDVAEAHQGRSNAPSIGCNPGGGYRLS
jgi:hypothetical protein